MDLGTIAFWILAGLGGIIVLLGVVAVLFAWWVDSTWGEGV